MGVRSRNNYLGYVFGSLWVIGLISFIALIASIVNNFRTKASVESEVSIIQPYSGKMKVKMNEGRISYYGSDWFGFDWNNDAPFYSLREDSVMMTTVRIDLSKSADSLYHVRLVRFSHGSNPVIAQDLASRIQFPVTQKDSILLLPQGFSITPNDKFRNQQVLVIVDVPVGKRIFVDANTEGYHWFSINVNRRRRGWNIDWNEDWGNSFPWENNVEYVMTNDGLQRTGRTKESGDDQDSRPKKEGDEGYRYKPSHDSTTAHPKAQPKHEKKHISDSTSDEKRTTRNDPRRETDRTQIMSLFTFLNSF
jgi:hypothetical protein